MHFFGRFFDNFFDIFLEFLLVQSYAELLRGLSLRDFQRVVALSRGSVRIHGTRVVADIPDTGPVSGYDTGESPTCR